MEPQPNDLWQGEFSVPLEGRHFYTLQAWTDHFQSWSRDLEKKFEAGAGHIRRHDGRNSTDRSHGGPRQRKRQNLPWPR